MVDGPSVTRTYGGLQTEPEVTTYGTLVPKGSFADIITFRGNYVNQVEFTLLGFTDDISPSQLSNLEIEMRLLQTNPISAATLYQINLNDNDIDRHWPFFPITLRTNFWSGANRVSTLQYRMSVSNVPGFTPSFPFSLINRPYYRYELSPPPQPELTRLPEPGPVVRSEPWDALPEFEWEPSDKENPVVVRAPIV